MSSSPLSWNGCTISQMARYSKITCTVGAPLMSLTHVKSRKASATVLVCLILSGTARKRHGARCSMALPNSYLSNQNRVLLPFPTCTDTEALKRAVMIGSLGPGNKGQDLDASERRSHSHLKRMTFQAILSLEYQVLPAQLVGNTWAKRPDIVLRKLYLFPSTEKPSCICQSFL